MSQQGYQIEVGMFKIRINQPGFGPRIISFFASDLQAQDLSAQPCLFPITGAPTGLTLPAGNGAYIIADMAFDFNGKVLYGCTQAGTNASSVWIALTSQGGFQGNYNPLQNYPKGSFMRVPNTTVINGITVLAGFYCAALDVNVGAQGPQGNQIPQFPEPQQSQVYWYNMSFLGTVVNQGCGGPVGSFANATNPLPLAS